MVPRAYLLPLLLLVLLGEEGVDPPDLGEHAAVRQAEAEAEEPQAELQETDARKTVFISQPLSSETQSSFVTWEEN